MHLPVNTLLQGGRYRIIRFIGSGGFGCTYEAEHVLLEKRVAIKEFFVKDFCNRDMTSQNVFVATEGKKALVEKLRRKFIDEARSLSRLHHPGIVSVSDVFEENDTAYFVMEYIDGYSLGQILRESGPLTEKRAVRYILQVADALRYLHSNNRLHLDIKPDNIMINTNDNAVLIDFGASKQYDEVNGENTSTLLGKTPGYAPMEQMGNDVIKFFPSTDIYSLGATLYKMLTGKTPLSATLIASGEELPPLPAGISENVRKAVDAAMQINKTRRPQTIDEFLGILSPERLHDTEETIVDVELQPETIKHRYAKRVENGSSLQSKGNDKLIVFIYILFVVIAVTIYFLLNMGVFGSNNLYYDSSMDTDSIAADSIVGWVGTFVTEDVVSDSFNYGENEWV